MTLPETKHFQPLQKTKHENNEKFIIVKAGQQLRTFWFLHDQTPPETKHVQSIPETQH